MHFAVFSTAMLPILAPAVGVCVCGLIAFLSLRLGRKSSSEPLQILMAELRASNQSPPPDEEIPLGRRLAERREDTCVGVLVSDFEAQAQPFTGYVLDRSSTGLGLALVEPVEIGDVLSVRAVNAHAGTPWVQVRVVYHNPLGKTFSRVGCKFVNTPPWNVLLLFG